MYYNVFGEKVSRRRFKEMCDAAKNRRELIAAGLTSRRDLLRMGLLTAGGMLVAKSGLSARAPTPRQITLRVRPRRRALEQTKTAYLETRQPAPRRGHSSSRCRSYPLPRQLRH